MIILPNGTNPNQNPSWRMRRIKFFGICFCLFDCLFVCLFCLVIIALAVIFSLFPFVFVLYFGFVIWEFSGGGCFFVLFLLFVFCLVFFLFCFVLFCFVFVVCFFFFVLFFFCFFFDNLLQTLINLFAVNSDSNQRSDKN